MFKKISVDSIGRSHDNYKKYLDSRVTFFNFAAIEKKVGRYVGILAHSIGVNTGWDSNTHWLKYLTAYDDKQDHLLAEIMKSAETSLREHIRGL